MSEKELLAEILRRPHLDEPRLVYADWLEDRGDPRSEFIRVQCALAQDNLPSVETRRLKEHERALLGVHGKKWAAPFPCKVREPRFIRGFVGHVAVGLNDFVSHGRQICETVPLESVDLTAGGGRKWLNRLIRCDWLQQVRSLSFLRNKFACREWFCPIASCPHLQNLRTLRIDSSFLSIGDAHALANATSMQNLRRLELSHTNVNEEELQVIAQSRHLHQLECLVVYAANLTGEFLSRATFNTSLRVLDLANDRVNSEAMGNSVIRKLLGHRPPICPHLRTLMLNETHVTNHAFIELVQSGRFPELNALGVNFCSINDDGAYVLANSKFLQQLRDVRMAYNRLSIDGISALARSRNRHKDAEFFLRGNSLQASDVEAFTREFGDFGSLRWGWA